MHPMHMIQTMNALIIEGDTTHFYQENSQMETTTKIGEKQAKQAKIREVHLPPRSKSLRFSGTNKIGRGFHALKSKNAKAKNEK